MRLSLIFLFCCVCIIIAGCVEEPETYDPRVGVRGLELSFPDFPEGPFFTGEPPQTFEIMLENRGAYDISYDDIFLFMKTRNPLSFSDVGAKDKLTIKPIQDLPGRIAYDSVGGIEHFFSTIYIPTPEQLSGTDEETYIIQSSLCYSYKTEVDVIACVGKRSGPDSCKFEDLTQSINLTPGQGAPVAVTAIEERIIESADGVGISFVITIQNMQDGQVYTPKISVEDLCSDPIAEPSKIKLGKVLLSDKELECSGLTTEKAEDNHFMFYTNPIKILCKVPELYTELPNYYRTLLSFNLEYVYLVSRADNYVTVQRQHIT